MIFFAPRFLFEESNARIQNLDKFDELFWKITDPKNAMYGKYMTIDEIADLTAPSAEAIAAVQEWLAASGMTVEGVSRSRDFIHFSGPVAKIERMLMTKFADYVHETGSKVTKASASYSVPAEMAQHIDYISGVVGLFKPHQKKTVAQKNVEDASLIGPAQLRARYNVTIIGSDAVNNSMAVAEFQGQYYSPQDLVTFFNKYVPQTTVCRRLSVLFVSLQKQPLLTLITLEQHCLQGRRHQQSQCSWRGG